MHRKGFVHRDIKTANVLVKNSRICLADLGLSIKLGPKSKTKQICSTLAYRSPEQHFKLQSGYDRAVDLWALGCLLVELVCGRPLFFFIKSEREYSEWLVKLFGGSLSGCEAYRGSLGALEG